MIRKPRTMADISDDLRHHLFCRKDAVAAGNWDAADRIQLTLDALQEEAAELAASTATTKGN